jgi:DNA-binding MarR family transcriptional regulator
MTTPQHTNQHVSVIRKELVALTQCSQLAIVLNQLLYWTQRVKDFELFLEEERTCSAEDYPSLNHGWVYKTADELIEETLLTVTRPTMRKYLGTLVEDGWVEEKRNPERRWDRTAHFRLNLKRIHNELLSLGYRLSGFEKGLFNEGGKSEFNLTSNAEQIIDQERDLASRLENLTEQEKNFTCQEESLNGENASVSLGLNNLPCKLKKLTPKLENFPSKERNLTSKLKNLTPYTYTETTTENKNKEHTHRTRACEETHLKNFSDVEESGSDGCASDTSVPDHSANISLDKSIPQEMVDLWEYHILQTFDPSHWKGRIQLTEDRESQLESLFAFHFQNDIKAWERFCIRIKSTPFLMGESPSGWHVSLDWIFEEGNFLKIFEGNFDKSRRVEEGDSCESRFSDRMSNQNLSSSDRNPEKDAILASIKDPIWREWCTRLSKGVALNDLTMARAPLTSVQLRQIANARFLAVEDDRLVWVGSSDPVVLNAIEKLRLQISWVYAKEYPQARAIRTRLDSQAQLSLPQPLSQGENL